MEYQLAGTRTLLSYIIVYNDTHVSRLLNVTSIFLDPEGTRQYVPVEIKLQRFKPNTTRRVTMIDPDDTIEEALLSLRCEKARRLACARLGRTNEAVLTFDPPTSPKVVKYHTVIVKVSHYQLKNHHPSTNTKGYAGMCPPNVLDCDASRGCEWWYGVA